MKKICFAGVLAALYTALSIVFGSLASSSFINVRPAEAFTVLPLLFAESIPGLTIGCLLTNLLTGCTPPDIIVGTLITFVAAVITRYSRKIGFGVLPPIVLNGLGLPLVWLLTDIITPDAYLLTTLSVLCSQFVWVAGLGIPLYYGMKKMPFFRDMIAPPVLKKPSCSPDKNQ